MTLWKSIQKTLAALAITAGLAGAQVSPGAAGDVRQSLNDAWFTGPMLAPSASTLPRGHFLIEPYLYDVVTQGFYDRDGTRRSAPRTDGIGSLTYILYGLANRFTVGMIPVAGYTEASNGPSSARVGMGDFTLQGQYRLKLFHEGSKIPTMSVAVQETLPTGKYDRLGNRRNDGFGGGAYTTTVAFYSQTYFWLPNGRVLRMRFNVAPAFSSGVNVHDVSVYGTSTGFRGQATPGASVFVDAAWEYSLTRRWVLALDAVYRYQANTPVSGYNALDPNRAAIRVNSGSSDAYGLAPAVEYNWNRNIGIVLGTRLIPAGRNTPSTITPAIAINYVH
jgi:Putative MetA-pathway of phenol degradation